MRDDPFSGPDVGVDHVMRDSHRLPRCQCVGRNYTSDAHAKQITALVGQLARPGSCLPVGVGMMLVRSGSMVADVSGHGGMVVRTRGRVARGCCLSVGTEQKRERNQQPRCES